MHAETRSEDARAAPHCPLAFIADVACFEVRGDDAAHWLQGQITADVLSLSPGNGSPSAILTARGRILSDLCVARLPDGFMLSTPPTRRGDVMAQLDRFVVMEDVELIARDDVAIVTLEGVAPSPLALRSARPITIDRLGAPAVDWLVPRAELPTIAVDLSTPADVERARIRRGVPRYETELASGAYIQEVGLERRAVSFGKGCYFGQEAVVMLAHRGRLTRRLYPLCVEGAEPLGDEEEARTLFDVDGRPAGKVTSTAPHEADDALVALGFVKLDKTGPVTPVRVGGRRASLFVDAAPHDA